MGLRFAVINGGNEIINCVNDKIRTKRTIFIIFCSFRSNLYNYEDHEGCSGGYMCASPVIIVVSTSAHIAMNDGATNIIYLSSVPPREF
jgi:hypothetical protein